MSREQQALAHLNPTGRWLPLYYRELSLHTIKNEKSFYQCSSDTAQQFHDEKNSYLSLLPHDMFNHYFRQGYLFSLLANTGRLFVVPKLKSPTAVACTADYLLVMYNGEQYIKDLYLFKRKTLQAIWKKEIVQKGKCSDIRLESNSESNGFWQIVVTTPEVAIITFNMQGKRINEQRGVVTAKRFNHSGSSVRIVEHDGLKKALLIHPMGLDGKIALPDQTNLSEDFAKYVSNAWGVYYPNNIIDINDHGNICVAWNYKIYLFIIDESFRINPPPFEIVRRNDFDLSPHGKWITFPDTLTEPVKWITVDNDNNVLLVQENSLSIYSAAGSLVRTYELELTSAAVCDGIIYGCTNKGLVVIE